VPKRFVLSVSLKPSRAPVEFAKTLGPIAENVIIRAILDAYNKLRNEKVVDSKWIEDKITIALYENLLRIWKSKPSIWPTPLYQLPLFPEVRTRGKPPTLDLAFSYGKSYLKKPYFAFECKIIGYKRLETIAYYIEEGMCRYIEEKYASKMEIGGMLGYALNNQMTSIVQKINGRIKKHRNLHPVECLIHDATRFKPFQDYYVSRHSRRKSHKKIALHHLFLNFG
jgi:hypothetical protein